MEWVGSRYQFETADVLGCDLPSAILRTYLEQNDLRALLKEHGSAGEWSEACDLGCGFGRLSALLNEFAPRVTGYEREEHLVQQARRLNPRVHFERIASLSKLPSLDAAFDLLVSFTVLQHMTDDATLAVMNEVKRVMKPSGLIVLCEETDVHLRHGDVQNPSMLFTVGRSVETYQAWMAPWRLIAKHTRQVEPTFDRQNVGHYMLFSR